MPVGTNSLDVETYMNKTKICQPIVRYRKENLRKQIATASRPTRGHASRLDRADLSNRQHFWGLHNGSKVILKSYFIFIMD